MNGLSQQLCDLLALPSRLRKPWLQRQGLFGALPPTTAAPAQRAGQQQQQQQAPADALPGVFLTRSMVVLVMLSYHRGASSRAHKLLVHLVIGLRQPDQPQQAPRSQHLERGFFGPSAAAAPSKLDTYGSLPHKVLQLLQQQQWLLGRDMQIPLSYLAGALRGKLLVLWKASTRDLGWSLKQYNAGDVQVDGGCLGGRYFSYSGLQPEPLLTVKERQHLREEQEQQQREQEQGQEQNGAAAAAGDGLPGADQQQAEQEERGRQQQEEDEEGEGEEEGKVAGAEAVDEQLLAALTPSVRGSLLSWCGRVKVRLSSGGCGRHASLPQLYVHVGDC